MRAVASMAVGRGRGADAFSLPELLVVVGIISLLVAVLLPPLQLARQQAMDAYCGSQLQQIGVALEACRNEFDFYPRWDDGGAPITFTWMDVLVQRRFLGTTKVGYCPFDQMPDPINAAHGRAVGRTYPRGMNLSGIDYSYGIGVPLSAGGWAWRPGYGHPGDGATRRFENFDRDTPRRVLVGDANWSWIYNLSGRAIGSGVWNDQTWYDNTVSWRHRSFSANLLMQDGHVNRLRYRVQQAEPVNTTQMFVWHPGEPIGVGPDDQFGSNNYPNTSPPSFQSVPTGDVYPSELLPYFYTVRRSWTLISHKMASTPSFPGY